MKTDQKRCVHLMQIDLNVHMKITKRERLSSTHTTNAGNSRKHGCVQRTTRLGLIVFSGRFCEVIQRMGGKTQLYSSTACSCLK